MNEQKIDFKLDGDVDYCEITLTTRASREIVKQMIPDEIFDAIADAINEGNISKTEVLNRFFDDFKDDLSELLNRFLNTEIDSSKYLTGEEQEELENDFSDWIYSGIKF